MSTEHATSADTSGIADKQQHPAEFELPSAGDLRELRLTSGLSVVEIADRVGCSTESVRRWERGEYEPRVSDARAWLDACRSEVNR